MSSHRLEISGAARKDIRSILRYTRLHWDEGQRDIYGQRLDAAMRHLATYPEAGRHVTTYPTGYGHFLWRNMSSTTELAEK